MVKKVFQDYMPGNICFGCGKEATDGLHIQSYWEGEESICVWKSEPRFQGWKNILNGGIIATLIDCHCMGTAMAAAYRHEGRDLDSDPQYRYATGTITVKYLLPTPNDKALTLKARVREIKGKKVVMKCDVWVEGKVTASSEVIAIRVVNTDIVETSNPFSS